MRSRPLTHDAFKVTAGPLNDTLSISLLKDGSELASIQIETKEASVVAAMVLGQATDAYDKTGKPPPYSSKDDLIDLTALYPSGYGVGPGRRSTTSMLLFHFGDTTLGIELPNSGLVKLGQRLMTSGAEGSAQ